MKKLLYILSATLLWSCEKEVDIKIPVLDHLLVCNGFINPDSLITIELHKSISILSTEQNQYIEGATVRLFEADNYLGEFENSMEGIYVFPDFTPVQNKIYRVEAEKNGYNKVVTSAIIPQKLPKIASVMVDSINREYGKELIYELEIDDPVEENYYEVLVLDRVKTFIYDPDSMEYIWSMDPVLIRANLNTEDLLVEEFQQFGQSFVFNDKLFNGNHYKFTFGPSHTVYNGNIGDNYESVYFILRNVSREYYLYKRSFALHEWVQGNPFAEPVPVFTNIENGFGIFAGFNQVVEEFEFH